MYPMPPAHAHPPMPHAHPQGKPQSYMSVQALRAMQSRAGELLGLIDGQGDLPDWVEYELARASAMLDSVFDYMEHGHGSVSD